MPQITFLMKHCRDCKSYTPNPINPEGGLGWCAKDVSRERLGLDWSVQKILPYPGAEACADFEEGTQK